MQKFVLENKNHRITFLDYGATIYEWIVKSKDRNIVLTNANLEDYKSSETAFLGTTIGRVTNRIRAGKFKIDNINYQLDLNFDNNQNAGHGGINGLWSKRFDIDYFDNNKVTFSHLEKDLETGFPGDLKVDITYILLEDGLEIQYQATTNKKTPINLTNHTYFNLSNEDTILNHKLQANSFNYLKADLTNAVTGEVINAKGTLMDLTQNKQLKILY